MKTAFTRDRFHLEAYPQMDTFRPSVYTGPAGTVANGTASRTQMGPLTKSIPFGTVPRSRVNGWNGSKWGRPGSDVAINCLST